MKGRKGGGKMRSIRTSLAALVLSGIFFGLNAVPVRAFVGSAHGDIPITDFDPSDDIHGDTSMLRTKLLQRVGEE